MTMTHQLHNPVRYQPRRDVLAGRADSHEADRTQLSIPALIVIGVIIIAAAIGFAGDAAASSPVVDSPAGESVEVYIVQPGDTLWEIAGSIAADGEDLRPIVDALQEASGGSNLDVGQRLVIDHAAIRG